MYNKYSALKDKNGSSLKHYHHVKIDQEFARDCEVWKCFLENTESVTITRPFVNFENSRSTFSADVLCFYTDASANKNLGFGVLLQR